MSDLTELAERCEQATGPDHELDFAIAKQLGVTVWMRNADDTDNYETTHWRYTASLDAAMTLVPGGFGWWFSCGKVRPNGEPPEANESFAMVWQTVGDERFRAGDERHGKIANPALALSAAALRARDASESRPITEGMYGGGQKSRNSAEN